MQIANAASSRVLQFSGGPAYTGNRLDQEIPLRFFGRQLLPSERREPVILRPLVVPGELPFRGDEPLSFEAMKSRIKRSRFNVEQFAGIGADCLADAVAVLRAPSQSLQDQHVERALQQFSL